MSEAVRLVAELEPGERLDESLLLEDFSILIDTHFDTESIFNSEIFDNPEEFVATIGLDHNAYNNNGNNSVGHNSLDYYERDNTSSAFVDNRETQFDPVVVLPPANKPMQSDNTTPAQDLCEPADRSPNRPVIPFNDQNTDTQLIKNGAKVENREKMRRVEPVIAGKVSLPGGRERWTGSPRTRILPVLCPKPVVILPPKDLRRSSRLPVLAPATERPIKPSPPSNGGFADCGAGLSPGSSTSGSFSVSTSTQTISASGSVSSCTGAHTGPSPQHMTAGDRLLPASSGVNHSSATAGISQRTAISSTTERTGLVVKTPENSLTMKLLIKDPVVVNREISSDPSMPVRVSVMRCVVCGDRGSGLHYGVMSCEGCKGFFRRCVQRGENLRCLRDGNCPIIRLNRNRCQKCRFEKCLKAGMTRVAVKGRKPTEKGVGGAEGECYTTGQQAALPPTADPLAVVASLAEAFSLHCRLQDRPARPAVAPAGVDCKLQLFLELARGIQASVRGVVEFAKHIPGFLALPSLDQLCLVKRNSFHVVLLTDLFLVRPTNRLAEDVLIEFLDGSQLTCRQGEDLFGGEFVQRYRAERTALRCQGHTHQYVCLLATLLLMRVESVRRTELGDRNALLSLNRVVEQLISSLPASADLSLQQPACNSVMDRVMALSREIADFINIFKTFCDRSQLPPVFVEVFDF